MEENKRKYRVVKEFSHRADSGEPIYEYIVAELLTVGLFKKKERWYPVTKIVSGRSGSFPAVVSFVEEEKAITYVKFLESDIEPTKVVYESN